jgi:hypothetical protein
LLIDLSNLRFIQYPFFNESKKAVIFANLGVMLAAGLVGPAVRKAQADQAQTIRDRIQFGNDFRIKIRLA